MKQTGKCLAERANKKFKAWKIMKLVLRHEGRAQSEVLEKRGLRGIFGTRWGGIIGVGVEDSQSCQTVPWDLDPGFTVLARDSNNLTD
jgi:hypothetical protein